MIPRKRQDDNNSASPASSHSNIDNIIAGEMSSRDSSPSVSSKGSDEKHSVTKDKDHKSHNKHHSSKSDQRSQLKESSSSSSHHSSGRKDKTDKSSSDKRNDSHSKSSHSSEKHSKHKQSENSHENHKSHKSEKSDKYKSESSHSFSNKKSESTSKHKHSSLHTDSSKTQHSSHNSKKSADKSNKLGKVSAKDLSLDELRAQVRQMKQEVEHVEKPKETTSTVASNVNPNMFKPHKDRQGVEMSEAEKRKAQILTKTQLILQRTKEKLARAKEEEKQPKKRLGKTSAGARKDKDDSAQVKSKSVCKDDDSDEDEPVNINFENSFNEEYLTQEPGSILKTIKSKIDEKLSSYNFPDKPAKERSPQKRKEKPVKEKNEKSSKERVKKEKHRLIEELKNQDRRELFGDKNSDSFHSSDDLNKNKIKKNKIVRRQQVQPPPMNFQDLLKLAETKSKEKVVEPEPIFQPPKKEERPMTKEERERLERQKESRRRVRQEELDLKKGKLPEDSNDPPSSSKLELADRVNSWLADNKKSSQKLPEKDGSKLKAALTGNHNVPNSEKFSKPGMISSKPSAFAKQNRIQEKEKSSKYDSENESVLSCKPSSSKPSSSKPSSSKPSKPINPYMDQPTNPWDRITGHMKKSNPKPGEMRSDKMKYRNDPKFSDRYAWANSAAPDKTAPRWSTLFAIPSS